MVTIKTPQEIKKMREGGKILAQVLHRVASIVKQGITTGQLEELACKLIKEHGGRPSFKGYMSKKNDRPFSTALCASINDEVVHAPALPPRTFKNGDIIGLDLGLEYKELFTDMAITVPVGQISEQAQNLIRVTRRALTVGIKQVKPGNCVNDISKAVQKFVERAGYAVVRELVGHGVGFKVHEEPRVPNFVEPRLPRVELKEGMTLAIEPMVNVSGCEIKTLDDQWTVVTKTGCLSGHFEHTVAVTKTGHEILTLYEEKRGRALGVDYGNRRVGLAISDDNKKIALVRGTVDSLEAISEIQKICQDEGVEKVVVGLPIGMSGEETEQTRVVKNFVQNLEKALNVPVVTTDERLTTKISESAGGGDAEAAAVILQGHIDRTLGY